ncbi:unnamed protein product [Gordionus sp. m RMFG-2023]|uniref:3-galactosyl-N-acetylglucosaminide 4-alpha-L-fucosyltransferase FUT3-like isoform X2 n=1 Tax=Gordionus sp. m RMFG-2023 TaxID=3053472 RepID=UPI0030E57B15
MVWCLYHNGNKRNNKFFSLLALSSISLIWVICTLKYFPYRKFGYSAQEEIEYSFLKNIRSFGNNDTKIILLYTEIYYQDWNLPSGYRLFDRCPNIHCFLTRSKKVLSFADLVVFHARENTIYPSVALKPSYQKWLFYMMESPHYTFNDYKNLKGLFDWTSTYTSDSDILSPYGAYLPYSPLLSNVSNYSSLEKQFSPPADDNSVLKCLIARKSRMALWMVHHCITSSSSSRETLALKLSFYFPIDVIGGCKNDMTHLMSHLDQKNRSKFRFIQDTVEYFNDSECFHGNKIETEHYEGIDLKGEKWHRKTNKAKWSCDFDLNHLASTTCLKRLGSVYKFYLAFENSLCKEYITEKFWYNALTMNMVPIVFGAPKSDYLKVAPPHSFIHLDDFGGNVEALAKYIIFLDSNDTEYAKYFEYKSYGKIENYILVRPTPSNPMWCTMCSKLHSTSRHLKSNNTLLDSPLSPLKDNKNATWSQLGLNVWWQVSNMCTGVKIFA